MAIPFGAALPINVKQPSIHAANGSVVFSCACGAGPFLIASVDSVVTCLTCKTAYQIQELRVVRTPKGVEVAAKIGKGIAPH
jgi:hypothetical protein